MCVCVCVCVSCVQVIVVPDIKGRAENVLWDATDPNVFVVAETTCLRVYRYHPLSINGEPYTSDSIKHQALLAERILMHSNC